ncbi:MAG: hypothetical protein AAF802_04415 [Planctomycetota bacterium]
MANLPRLPGDVMRKLIFTSLLGLVCYFSGCSSPSDKMNDPVGVEYRGERYSTTKTHDSYDDYLDDSEPFSAAEIARISHAVSTADVPPELPVIADVVQAIHEVKFPGYGSATLMPLNKALAGQAVAMNVDIPGTKRVRLFVYQRSNGTFRLTHDFETDNDPMVTQYDFVDGNLQLFSYGEQLLVQPPTE